MSHLTVVPIPHQRSGCAGPVLSLHLGCVSLSWHRCLRRHHCLRFLSALLVSKVVDPPLDVSHDTAVIPCSNQNSCQNNENVDLFLLEFAHTKALGAVPHTSGNPPDVLVYKTWRAYSNRPSLDIPSTLPLQLSGSSHDYRKISHMPHMLVTYTRTSSSIWIHAFDTLPYLLG